MELTYLENLLVRRALGMETGKSVKRNRVSVHQHGTDIATAKRAADKGFLVHNKALDYGSMQVFCVTAEGAKAIGKRLPAALQISSLN
jgi:hypothetical protein